MLLSVHGQYVTCNYAKNTKLGGMMMSPSVEAFTSIFQPFLDRAHTYVTKKDE